MLMVGTIKIVLTSKIFMVNALNDLPHIFCLWIFMLLRIVRDLTSEEVEERIERFERRFGMSFEEFEELFSQTAA